MAPGHVGGWPEAPRLSGFHFHCRCDGKPPAGFRRTEDASSRREGGWAKQGGRLSRRRGREARREGIRDPPASARGAGGARGFGRVEREKQRTQGLSCGLNLEQMGRCRRLRWTARGGRGPSGPAGRKSSQLSARQGRPPPAAPRPALTVRMILFFSLRARVHFTNARVTALTANR